jgi:branched-chain amino acid transport system substrate-binding protein
MKLSAPGKTACIALVAALVLAACGSSDKNDSASSGSASTGARGVTETEIRIEGIAPLTSPSGGYPGADIGAKARFERVNEEGGIAGRKINYLGTLDDNEDGAKNLDLSHKAVQDDNVFAVVPMLGAGFLPASSDYLNKEKVPAVGWGFMPGFCSGPETFGFGFNGCIQPPGAKVVNTAVAAPIVEKLGKGIKVAIVSDDSANSTDGLKTVKAAFIAEGADVVYAKPNVPTTEKVDYTPFVQDVMTSNNGGQPDLVVFNSLFANTVGITAGLKAAGYKGDTMNYIAYIPGLLEQSADTATALDGSYVNPQFLPMEFGGDAVQQMERDIKAVAPDAQITLGTEMSYLMADVFVQMLESAGKDLTGENFGKVINGGWTYKPEGNPALLGTLEYPKGHTEPAPCSALVQIKGTKYEPVSPMKCYRIVPIGDVPSQ